MRVVYYIALKVAVLTAVAYIVSAAVNRKGAQQ